MTIFLMRGEKIQIALKEGHHQIAFRLRADDGRTLNAGLVTL